MTTREKELIAIGAAVTGNCVPCLKFHVEKAEAAGASNEDIAEAISVGRTVRTGSARTWDEEAADIFPGLES